MTASASGEAAASLTVAAMRAVADRPDMVRQIVRRAVSLDPDSAGEIAGALSRAYPGFAEITSEPAAQTNPGAAPEITQEVRAAVPEYAREAVTEPEPSGETEWDGEIEIGGTRSTGNTENEDLFAAVEITTGT